MANGMADLFGSEISKIDWKNQSYDEFSDILDDIAGKRNVINNPVN